MVDFICMGLLELKGAQSENYKMQNVAHSGLELMTLANIRPLGYR